MSAVSIHWGVLITRLNTLILTPPSGTKVSESLLTKSNKKVEELQTKLVAKTEELMEAQKTWMEVRETLRKSEDECQRKEKK